MSLIASSHGKLFRLEERQGLPLRGLAAFASSCFEISRPHPHGIASKQALVPKTIIINNKSAILVGCGYKDELKYR